MVEPSNPTNQKINNEDKTNLYNDLKLKAKAFKEDFKLPLNGAEVHISSLRGGIDVANGYDRVVPDGESLLLELSEERLFKSNFKPRQRTKSRQYYTMQGVTLHKQLALESHA